MLSFTHCLITILYSWVFCMKMKSHFYKESHKFASKALTNVQHILGSNRCINIKAVAGPYTHHVSYFIKSTGAFSLLALGFSIMQDRFNESAEKWFEPCGTANMDFIMCSPPIRETPFSAPCRSAERQISWSAALHAGSTPSLPLVHLPALSLRRNDTRSV